MIKPVTALLMTALGVAAVATAWPLAGAERAGWDREAAATYLDARMDAWFANATKLRTGEGTTACVSCHTPMPYALARPALRRALRVSTATSLETKLRDEVTRRVDTYGTHQLLYEMNEDKKAESRGTEAVLNALILASGDAAERRREPSEATRKAMARLWETERPDGAWDWLNFKLEPYETVDAVYHGATLAALAAGMAPGLQTAPDPAASVGLGRLRVYLRDKFATQSLYNRTFALLASAGLRDVLTRAQRDGLVAELQGRQQTDGGWSLEGMGPWRWSRSEAPFSPQGTLDLSLLRQSDGFATGLIVYALSRAGLRADHPAVRSGVQWLKSHQREIHMDEQTWTAWRAYSLNVDREHGGASGQTWRRLFMSDAATAFAVLALVEVEPE